MRQSIRHTRHRNMPANPRTLEEMEDISDQYQRTLQGERFLMFDSRQMEVNTRVPIFVTQKNIELLCRSSTWFLDGTFKVSSTIFSQLFTIIGLWNNTQAERENTPLPFVYPFLSSKEQAQYKTILQAVKDAVVQYRLLNCVPQKIMTDFEKGITNAAQEVFPEIQVACCFFHFGQSVCRQVQDKGLQ